MQTYLTLATHPMLWAFLCLLAGFYLILWATALDVRRMSPRTVWLRRHYPAVILTGVAILAIIALTFYLVEIGISVRILVDRLREAAANPRTQVGDLQSLASTVAILVGVLAAAATILYSSIRVWINERTATATEEGLITDRINKAVQGLGAEKTVNRLGRTIRFKIDGIDGSYFEWIEKPQARPPNPDVVDGKVQLSNDPWSSFPDTQPNLEVRIGAIYALERIAQDSARDHVQVMEILCAYIRQNAPYDPEQTIPEDWEDAWDDARDAVWDDENNPLPNREMIKDWALGCDRPREDVQVALTVIGRRSAAQIAQEGRRDADGVWRGYRLDLRQTCLQRVDLRAAHLENTQFYGAQLQGADLRNAQLRDAHLRNVLLQGANLKEAHMKRANLRSAQMQGVDLEVAQMQGADLKGVQLQSANLTRSQLQETDLTLAQMQGASAAAAQMQEANLHSASMQGAFLIAVRMQGTNLTSARIQGADLRGVQMQKATLNSAQMQKADLSGAQLQGAALHGAQMQKAYLHGAQLQGAALVGAEMRGAQLNKANLQEADLSRAHMQTVDFSRAQLQRANFSGAQMQGALLWESQFDLSSDLSETALRGAGLRQVEDYYCYVTQDQLNSIFSDQTAKISYGLSRPKWPETVANKKGEFNQMWRAWQKSIGFDPGDSKTW